MELESEGFSGGDNIQKRFSRHFPPTASLMNLLRVVSCSDLRFGCLHQILMSDDIGQITDEGRAEHPFTRLMPRDDCFQTRAKWKEWILNEPGCLHLRLQLLGVLLTELL